MRLETNTVMNGSGCRVAGSTGKWKFQSPSKRAGKSESQTVYAAFIKDTETARMMGLIKT